MIGDVWVKPSYRINGRMGISLMGMGRWRMDSRGPLNGVWIIIGGRDVDGNWSDLMDGRVSMMVGDGK